MSGAPIEPVALVAEALECDPASLTPESRLGVHPQWDSLGHLRLMMSLEQYYGVAIDDQSIRTYETLAQVIARYCELTRAATPTVR